MNRSWIAPLSLLTAVACGDADTNSDNPSPEFGQTRRDVAPVGSDASVVSNDLPASMAPGEKRLFTIEMSNDGTVPANNIWNGNYYLYERTGDWGTRVRRVTTDTPTGNTFVFRGIYTAPTVGVATATEFRAEMFSGDAPDTGFFGDILSQNINVDPALTPAFNCASTGNDLPATMTPGETRNVTITLQNTGTQTWPVNAAFCLRARHDPRTLYGNDSICISMPRDVPPAPDPLGTVDVTFEITAPTVVGPYDFEYQMFDGTTVGFFDDAALCVDDTVNVQIAGTDPLDATVVDTSVFPATMAPGESRVITVTIQNTGTDTWPNDGSFFFYSQNTPRSLWGVVNRRITEAVAPGSSTTVAMVLTAPATPGTYAHTWQMFRNTTGFFGDLISVPVTVDGASVPELGAAVVTQNIPANMGPGEVATFEITMQNTGTSDWVGSNVLLRSTNDPNGLWGVTIAPLDAGETVAGDAAGNGETRVFSFLVTAPLVQGTYESRWRMLQSGVSFFGEEAVTLNINVNPCGDGTVDPTIGESCDDGNNVDNDGCSATCVIEPLTVDLANVAAGRTIIGPQSFRQLGNVAIGDVTGDETPEVLTAGAQDVIDNIGVARALGGAVHGFTGGNGFFDGTTTTTTGAVFEIVGEANSYLGGSASSGLLVGDVTGDGTNDIIVSAFSADGAGGAADAGAIYVIRGGALNGRISVEGRDPADPNVFAVIRGVDAGDRLFIAAVGELTGDAFDDIVIGIPGNDFNGVDNVGGFVIIEGGPSLAGVRTITATGAAGIVHGAGDGVGLFASVGDVNGDNINDLVWGDPSFDNGAATRAGAIFAVQGPFTQVTNTARVVDATNGTDHRIIGAARNDRFGSAIEFGNVQGDNTNELVVGEFGHHIGGAGLQVGAVNVFTLPLPATTDLTVTDPFTRLIGGEFQTRSGATLALGDVNRDGFLDIPVVTPLGDGLVDGTAGTGAGLRSGEVAIILGGATLTAGDRTLFNGGGLLPATLQIFGPDANGRMANHVHGLDMADIDGDGAADICLGSHFGGTGGALTQPGRIDCIESIW